VRKNRITSRNAREGKLERMMAATMDPYQRGLPCPDRFLPLRRAPLTLLPMAHHRARARIK